MNVLPRKLHELGLLLALLIWASRPCQGQQAGATGQPLVISTTTLPHAFLNQMYEIKLEARGGTVPLRWEVSDGAPPPGVILDTNGLLKGIPTGTGEFRFTITVSDSGRPAYQRSEQLTVIVLSPLFAQWSRYPTVKGQRLEGSIAASNETDHDFDLTVIVLAVDDNTQRATAIGYQHFTLKKNTGGIEIPFGDNLPHGAYQLNADLVAEVPSTNSIYRARLVPKEKFQILQGP
jgi:Putative Ig domain